MDGWMAARVSKSSTCQVREKSNDQPNNTSIIRKRVKKNLITGRDLELESFGFSFLLRAIIQTYCLGFIVDVLFSSFFIFQSLFIMCTAFVTFLLVSFFGNKRIVR